MTGMAIPHPLPEEMILKPSRVKWIGVFLTGSAFSAGGVWMISEGDQQGWLVAIFFGLVTIVSVVPLFSRSIYLRLHKDGFEQVFMSRKIACKWSEVSPFGVWSMQQSFITIRRSVTFSLRRDDGKVMASINKAVSGGSSHLADNFGMKAQALADLMNAYRRRALSGR